MPSNERARVLAVDDVPDAAEALAAFLQADGYEVRTANDGVRALKIAAEFKPHCVLLDIGMPRMDGLELAKVMRKSFGDGIVLIALTGRPNDDVRVVETFALVDHYLRKPFDPDQLRKILPPPKSR